MVCKCKDEKGIFRILVTKKKSIFDPQRYVPVETMVLVSTYFGVGSLSALKIINHFNVTAHLTKKQIKINKQMQRCIFKYKF